MFYAIISTSSLLLIVIFFISRLIKYGQKLEREQQQEKALGDIYKANILRDKLQRDNFNLKRLRKRFTRK